MPDPRKKLYNALTSNNFDLGSYDEFNSKMDNPESRKKLYDAAGANNFDIGSYDDFESKIGGKKKNNSSSTSSDQKLASEQQNGSSDGQTNTKISSGFPESKTNNPLDQFIPKPSKSGENKSRVDKLKKELSSTKVTPDNMDIISSKTDELSALQKEEEKQKQAEKNYRVNQLENSFYNATKDNNDDAVAEQRLQDAVNVKGVWNNIKDIAKKGYNSAVKSIATTNPGAIGLVKYVTDTDPLADEKKQIISEAKKSNEKLSEPEISERAQELFKSKEKDNLFIDRANSFLDNLPEKDKEILKQDRAAKSDHLAEDNLKRLKVSSAMRTVAENKISEYKDIEKQLSKLQEKNEQFPEELYQRYQSLGNEIKNIGSELQKNEDYILKNKKDLGTVEQELDLFNREYGDVKNFLGNIGASASELGSGILGAANYVNSLSPNAADNARALDGQKAVSDINKNIEENRNNLRTPVSSVESAEGFLNYASDLVANQLPILAVTASGAGGLAAIGTSSAGKKFTEMNNDVLEGKATYSPLQMATAPLLYGGAEMAGEYATMGILQKGGRVLESIARGEADLIKKTAVQKAKEWAKDFGVDMSQEMTGEQFTNFAQNFNDKFVLGKKDVGLLDNTGTVFKDTFTLTSILKAAPHVFGAVVKPFQSKSDLGKLDENSRKIIEFSQQLDSPELTNTEIRVIENQIEKATAESSLIFSNTIGEIDSMPTELYNEVVNLNTKAGEIKAQAREIADGNLSNKQDILKSLEQEYKDLQNKRSSIIDGKVSVLEVLPLKEQDLLKKEALNELKKELNPTGEKNITIDNDQISERAKKIYDRYQNLDKLKTKTKEFKTGENQDAFQTYVTSEDGKDLASISVIKNGDIYEVGHSEVNGKIYKGKGIGYAAYKAMIDESNKRGIEVYSDPQALSQDAQKVWERLEKNGLAEKVQDIKGNKEYTTRESFPQFKTIPHSLPEIDIIAKKGAGFSLEEGFSGNFLENYDFLDEGSEHTVYRSKDGKKVIKLADPNEKKKPFNQVVSQALEINELVGDGSLKVIGTYKDTKGNRHPVYEQDFIEGEKATKKQIEDHLKDLGFVIKKDHHPRFGNSETFLIKNRGEIKSIFDLSDNFIVDKNGNVIAIDAAIRTLSPDSIPKELRDQLNEIQKPEKVENESPTRNDAPTNGNIRSSVDETRSSGEDTRVQGTVNTPTRKGEVTKKLEKINKDTFGLNDKQSKASTNIIEKTLETMAKRSGISKEEMFDKITFEKGDKEKAVELSKKGNALFQIIGKSAKLSSETKQFLKDAQTLEKQGVNPKDIYLRTGWEKGTDGKWKYDMQEGKAEYIKQSNGKLSEVFDYKELFDKYPDAKKIDIIFKPNMDGEGMYDEKKNRIFINPSSGPAESRLTILHEIQHWIQNKEGFSKGGSVESARNYINEKINKESNSKSKSVLNKFKSLISAKQTDSSGILKTLDDLKKISTKSDFDIYQSIAGEVEARNVEKRLEMTPEERKRTSISETEDIAASEQIVLSDKNSGKMFQIIGERANLSNEVKNDLLEAKNLDAKGINSKDIYKKTGWEKGTDGKWKYDMQEGKIEFNNTVGNGGDIGNVLDYNELYEKYPETRDLKLLFNDTIEGYGFFYPKGNMIVVNPNFGKNKSKSTILHEIQHWIQMKEDFAVGGNLKSAKEESMSFLNKKIELIEKIASSKNPDHNLLNKELSIVNKIYSKEDFDLYESLSGEVESRNVESRMNMSKEDRRNTPISETEDVGRDEQLILFQGEQGAMLAEDGKFIIYALEDPNISTPLHELAHVYEHYLTDNERNTVLEYSGQKEWNRETSERFARGFEKYLADGTAPNPEMKKLFEDFKKWLTDIYKGITNSEIDINISPEMQKIFDTMLGAEKSSSKVTFKGAEFTIEKTNGETKILNKDGKEIKQYTTRKTKDGSKRVKNANYYKILAVSEGNLTENEINTAAKKQIQESIDNFIPSNEYEVALLEISKGTKFSKESLEKELGNKDSNWASDQFSKRKMPSIENVAEGIVAENQDLILDEQEVRNALIDVLVSFENIDSVKQQLNDTYQKSIDPYYGLNETDAINAYEEFMTDSERSLFESVQAEQNLSEEEKLKYYQEQYEKSIESISAEERGRIYEQFESERSERLPNSSESNEDGNREDGSQKQDSKEKVKSAADQFLDWLEEIENNLDQFGKEHLSSGLPIVVAKAAIQTMRAAVKAGMAVSEVIKTGLDSVKQSEWYNNLNSEDKIQAEKDFEESFNNPQIEEESQRQTENLRQRAASENISEDDAFEEVSKTFEKEREELKNQKPGKEYIRDAYRNYVKRFTDRQYLSKSLLSKTGLRNTKNLIINSKGASGKAKLLFEEAYDKIYKGLTRTDRNTLDEIIQSKRFIAIDENREERGLNPVSHPNFIDKNKSEKFLSKLEKNLGEEKYKDLEKRATEYFKTYKDLLKQVYDNGLISKESFDSMSNVDYQPRVFLQFVTDFNGDLAAAKKTNNLETGGLSSEQIKSMDEGDASSLVLNSEWLLTNSLLARQKAIAMNNINKRFILDEYKKAHERFEKLDPKNLEGDDKRFYNYFKELSSKVIDNPLVKVSEGERSKLMKEFKKLGHDLSKLDENFRLDFPELSVEENTENELEIYKPKYDKTPPNFQKAYYYDNGQQKHFFLEQGLYDSWTDNFDGIFKGNTKEILSYATGSAIVKAIATGNNPAFPIVNTPRDFMFTATFSDQYSNFIPKALLQVGKDAFKSFKELRNSDSDVLKKYIEYGGAMDFLSSEGRLKKNSLVGKAMEKIVDPKSKDIAKNVFSKVTLSKISEYSEMMFRLGIFQRSIQNQLKDLGVKDISDLSDKQQIDDLYNEAVTSARSILDFNQGGVVTKDLEAIVPYINVAFQGGRVAATALQKNPVGTTARILQMATLGSSIPIGISLTLLSALKPDDKDDEKSAGEIYLHAMDGISAYQKSKYMNIPLPFKDANGEYMVIKIAKAQELSPVMSVTDDIYTNIIRSMVGKDKKTVARIIDDAAFTFNSNVMPIDFTSPAGFFTRTPIVKGTLTYTTGYDFFKDEPLSNDIGKVPKPVEGLNNPNVEDFYKKIGEEHGISPIRSKAFVESLITGPNTNPFVGILYGGMDATVSDKDMKKIGEDLFKSVYKSTGKRIVSYPSNFNRQLAARKDLQEKIDKINIDKYKMKAEFNQLAKDFIAKDITKEQVNEKLKELDPADRKRMFNKIKDKIRLQDIDGAILDIKYEQGNDVKALMIMHYYGDISDGSKDSKKILSQMKRAKGVITPGVIYEYKKLKKELDTKKAPE